MQTTEFQMDSCVWVVTIYIKMFEWHFGEVLPAVREFSNFVDHYTVAMKKYSSDNVPWGFEYSFGSDHACSVHSELKSFSYLARNSKSHETN